MRAYCEVFTSMRHWFTYPHVFELDADLHAPTDILIFCAPTVYVTDLEAHDTRPLSKARHSR